MIIIIIVIIIIIIITSFVYLFVYFYSLMCFSPVFAYNLSLTLCCIAP
jgi:hypothetical protein